MTPEEYRARRMEYSTQIRALNDQYHEVYQAQFDLIASLNAEFAQKYPQIWRLCFYFEDNGKITIAHNGLFTSKQVAEKCLESIKGWAPFLNGTPSICLVKTDPKTTTCSPINHKMDGTEWFYTTPCQIDSNGVDLYTQEYYDLQDRLNKLQFHENYMEGCMAVLEESYANYMRYKTFYALVDLDQENTLSYDNLEFSLAMPTPNENQRLIRVPGSKLGLADDNIHTEVPEFPVRTPIAF